MAEYVVTLQLVAYEVVTLRAEDEKAAAVAARKLAQERYGGSTSRTVQPILASVHYVRLVDPGTLLRDEAEDPLKELLVNKEEA